MLPRLLGAGLLLVGLAVSALVVYAILASAWSDMEVLLRWQEGSCEVTNARVERLPGQETPYQPVIHYERFHDGALHTGDSIRRLTIIRQRPPAFSSYRDAASELRGFASHRKLPCYFDPVQPDQMVLERSTPLYAAWALLPLAICLLLGALLVSMLRAKAGGEQRDTLPTETPATVTPETVTPDTATPDRTAAGPQSLRLRCLGAAALLLLFSAVSAAGGALIETFVLAPRRQAAAAAAWPEHRCKVVAAEVLVIHGDDGAAYRPDIFYCYQLDRAEHCSNSYDVYENAGPYTRAEARNIVARYSAGSEVPCYVNPTVPEEALLDRDLRSDRLPLIAGCVFLLVGALGVIHALYQLALAAMPHRPTDTGRQVVRFGTARRLQRAGTLLLAALVWNGIVLMLAAMALGGVFRPSLPQLMILAVIFLFGLAGLAILAALARAVVTCFLPGVELSFDADSLRPGHTVELSWKVLGRIEQVARLRLSLEATERLASGDETKETVISRIDLLDAARPAAAGDARFELPADIPVTHAAAQQTIEWKLGFVADYRNGGRDCDSISVTIARR